ncbi:MAG: prephenate dehydrogenase dimerization domain-containing protein, partial [Anaerolineales bacterium]
LIAIAAPLGTSARVLQLAEDLIISLGARPLFSDASEIDGLVSRASLLPALTAAAMLHTTLGRPGWQEARKMAGVAYRAFLNALLSDEAASLEQATLLNRDNVLRALDDLLSSLQELRAHLEAETVESLGEYLGHARTGGQKWWEERQAGLWEAPSSSAWNEVPSFGERMNQSLFGGRKRSADMG